MIGRVLIFIAALYGLTGVAMAAAAAHMGFPPTVGTATVMQFIHALASLAALALLRGRASILTAIVFRTGTLLFAGALYSSALLAVSLGPVAPTGGVILMVGWALLGWFGLTRAAMPPLR